MRAIAVASFAARNVVKCVLFVVNTCLRLLRTVCFSSNGVKKRNEVSRIQK